MKKLKNWLERNRDEIIYGYSITYSSTNNGYML
jgi:hypothetical protein